MIVIGIVFNIMAALCFGYYAFAASYAGIHSAFLWFWPLAGLGCIVVAAACLMDWKYHWMRIIPKWIWIIFGCIVICGVALFLFLEGCVISGMNKKADRPADYVIVLGAQVRGERVTKSLAKRLDAAFEYATAHTDTRVIVSGGQGTGEDISEALAMKRYLENKGLNSDRIIMEDKSTTTRENLIFSRNIIGNCDASVVIVTNNFHVFRACKLAKKQGYTNVSAIAADSDNHLIINYMVREALAIFKEKLMGNI